MAHKVVYSIVMAAAVLVAITGSPDEAQSHSTTPDHAIFHIENEVDKNSNRMDAKAVGFASDVESASSVAEAEALRDEAAGDVQGLLNLSQRAIERHSEDFPNDENVQEAYDDAHENLHDAANAAIGDINATYAFWLSQNGPGSSTTTIPSTLPPVTTLPPITTTTTKPPATTTTKPPPTTTTTTTTTTRTPNPPETTVQTTSSTTSTSTTTTTVAGGSTTPPSGPSPFTPDMPLAVVLGESLETTVDNDDRGVQSIELVRRLVDTQLPSGVSQVAVSPLLVLELILNAILAAGSLMLLPWVALTAYAIYLARDMRVRALGIDLSPDPS